MYYTPLAYDISQCDMICLSELCPGHGDARNDIDMKGVLTIIVQDGGCGK